MNAIASEVLSYHQIDREQVRAFFGFSSYPHLARFVAAVEGSTVVLKGVSRSFHSKQLAQNVAVRALASRE